MSREERRAYKRMTKNQDPYALPAGTQRVRQRATRSRRPATPSGEFQFVTGRYLAWTLGGALLIGLIAFSIAWPNGMPSALYVGLGAGAVWLAAAVAFRFAQRRMAALQR
jgi:hypothetical protein